MSVIPEKIIERFCRYRQLLLEIRAKGEEYVFSHQLAQAIHASSTQVRRDLMKLPLRGSAQRGYHIDEMLTELTKIIDVPGGQQAALVGVGNLGLAILSYFIKRRPNLFIVAAFDNDPQKVNRVISGCKSYPLEQLEEIISREKVSVGIITVPADVAQEVADRFVQAGVKGIVNFAPVHLKLPENVFLETLDITMSIEKTAYFAKALGQGDNNE